MQNNPKKSKN